MKNNAILLLFSVFLMSAFPLAAQTVAVPYGEGKGEIDYINTNKFKILEDPHPYSAGSFRVLDNGFAVADSVAGKLLLFDKKGKLENEIFVYPQDKRKKILKETGMRLALLISDFVPALDHKTGKIESWFVADTMNNLVYHCDTNGKHIAEISDGNFLQIGRIELDKKGNLYVSDIQSQTISVFGPDRKKILVIPWQWSGLAVPYENGGVYTLESEEEVEDIYLVLSALDGKIPLQTLLALPENISDPELWWVNEKKKEAFITYTPPEGYKGEYVMASVSIETGKVKASKRIRPIPIMTRYLDIQKNFSEAWIADCNYLAAPKGTFDINKLELPFKLESGQKGKGK